MSNAAWLVPLADKVPDDNDVVAGWTGFAVFVFLIVALVFLMISFSKRLRNTRAHFGVDKQGNPVDDNGEHLEPVEPAEDAAPASSEEPSPRS